MPDTPVAPVAQGSTPAPAAISPPANPVRVESEAVYVGVVAGVAGAIFGFVLGLTASALPLEGDISFGRTAALATGAVAIVTALLGYWRSRNAPGQEWRLRLSPWQFAVNTTAVVLVHTVLAVLATIVLFLVLDRGFIGVSVTGFWSTVVMAVLLALCGYTVYLSVSRMTTQRMASLLMLFVVLGTLTAMVQTPDPTWWEKHFSHLGTFWHLSSFVFNGTLIVGGLVVVTFAVYLSHDIERLSATGRLANANAARIVSVLFVIMGVMLAGVGCVPVNISLIVHNSFASGMAVMYLALLCAGPWVLRGMPRSYFLASAGFLVALVVSCLLFFAGSFSLTTVEIVIFALIFGWISVFIRFLGASEGTAATPAPVE